MVQDSSKKVTALIQSVSHDLQPLFSKIKYLEKLNLELDTLVDPAVRQYCQIANYHNGCLVLLIANASVAMQLRFQKMNLLADLKKRKLFSHVNNIEFKIRPLYLQPLRLAPAVKRKVPRLSVKTAQIIRDAAAGIDDPKLQAIMRKIAEHTD